MKLLIALTIALSFQTAKADTNSSCRLIYRDGIEHVKVAFDQYSRGIDSKAELALHLASTSSVVNATRAYCSLVETAENRTCVQGYGEIYKELRSQVSILSLLTGNQEQVAKRGIVSRFKDSVKLKALDVRCGY